MDAESVKGNKCIEHLFWGKVVSLMGKMGFCLIVCVCMGVSDLHICIRLNRFLSVISIEFLRH